MPVQRVDHDAAAHRLCKRLEARPFQPPTIEGRPVRRLKGLGIVALVERVDGRNVPNDVLAEDVTVVEVKRSWGYEPPFGLDTERLHLSLEAAPVSLEQLQLLVLGRSGNELDLVNPQAVGLGNQ